MLNVSLEEVDRLIRIIKDLLLLAQLDYNPDVFQFEKIHLPAFLEEICNYTRILAEQKGLESALHLPKDGGFVEGDKVHLRRLFLNLINNAVKFTPEGGKLLSHWRPPGRGNPGCRYRRGDCRRRCGKSF
ncbi:MAG: hypothetical protein R2861_10375 [Desulfobacterales bacterium]